MATRYNPIPKADPYRAHRWALAMSVLAGVGLAVVSGAFVAAAGMVTLGVIGSAVLDIADRR